MTISTASRFPCPLRSWEAECALREEEPAPVFVTVWKSGERLSVSRRGELYMATDI